MTAISAKSLTLRSRGYELLGVPEYDVIHGPQITPQLRMISSTVRRAGQPEVTRRILSARARGATSTTLVADTRNAVPYGPGADILTAWPDYLRATDAESAASVLAVYDSISPTFRRHLPIEAFCRAAGVSPLRILEVLTATVVRLGAQASTIIASVNHPRIVEKTVEMALTDGGIEDRSTLHKATGFLPTPKSAQTNISVVTTANSASASQSVALPAPAPESTVRRLADRFNEARALPAAAATPEELAARTSATLSPARAHASTLPQAPTPATVPSSRESDTIDAEFEDAD